MDIVKICNLAQTNKVKRNRNVLSRKRTLAMHSASRINYTQYHAVQPTHRVMQLLLTARPPFATKEGSQCDIASLSRHAAQC
jgi:hypothetical protein